MGLAVPPCKRKAQTSTTKVVAKQEVASGKIPKTIYGCMVESHESTRQRVDSSLPTKHEDRIAGKGFTSMTHYNLVHKFILLPQAMKIPEGKAAVDKECAETVAWSNDLEGHARKCVERYCELANKKTEELYKVSSPCLDDHHHFKKEDLESVGELSNVCSQLALKCF